MNIKRIESSLPIKRKVTLKTNKHATAAVEMFVGRESYTASMLTSEYDQDKMIARISKGDEREYKPLTTTHGTLIPFNNQNNSSRLVT